MNYIRPKFYFCAFKFIVHIVHEKKLLKIQIDVKINKKHKKNCKHKKLKNIYFFREILFFNNSNHLKEIFS